ncbi:MAG: DNA-binding protein [Candidatus Methanoperedens sp.]|nr:DNA-binding protein [Candidatus Methanoperedens sp.]
MIQIADSSLFIIGKRIEGIIITVPSVVEELIDGRSRTMLDLMNVRVEPPLYSFISEVKTKAGFTKDSEELSKTDIDILAKALEFSRKEESFLISDDYAVQNTALHLGIKVRPVSQKKIRDVIQWEKFCIGCRRRFPQGDDCPVCGTALKKIRKRNNVREI